MYLVLGALACADMEQMQAFKDHGAAIKGRKELYETGYNMVRFTTRAQQALLSAGFTNSFVKMIKWENFDEAVWTALSTLRNKLILLDEAYDAPDCPCMNVVVAEAVLAENKVLNAQAEQ